MTVEFLGCTGAGKTTLVQEMVSRLAPRTAVITSEELVCGLIGLHRFSHPTLQNFVQEIIAFPVFLYAAPFRQEYLRSALRLIRLYGLPGLEMLSNLRSVERNVGSYEISRRFHQGRVVLMDEGPSLLMHMLSYTPAVPTDREIEAVSRLLPLPDVFVYVRVPVEKLVQRSMERRDTPRGARGLDRQSIEQLVRRTRYLFDRFVSLERIRERLFVVDLDERGDRGYARAVDELCARILIKYASNGYQAGK